jgi:hypothetical protein
MAQLNHTPRLAQTEAALTLCSSASSTTLTPISTPTALSATNP